MRRASSLTHTPSRVTHTHTLSPTKMTTDLPFGDASVPVFQSYPFTTLSLSLSLSVHSA